MLNWQYLEIETSDFVLQFTIQFFLFALLWTTQYAAPSSDPTSSTASTTYKYSTCTCTSHSVCPTCLQPIPYQPRPLVPCHRLLWTPPRLCPATAASGKPASPTSATITWSRCRDVQPHPCQQLSRSLWPPAAPFTQRRPHGHPTLRSPPLPRSRASWLYVL